MGQIMGAKFAVLSQLQREAAEGFDSEHSPFSPGDFNGLNCDLKFTNGSLNLSLFFFPFWLTSKSLIFTEVSVCLLFKDREMLHIVSLASHTRFLSGFLNEL